MQPWVIHSFDSKLLHTSWLTCAIITTCISQLDRVIHVTSSISLTYTVQYLVYMYTNAEPLLWASISQKWPKNYRDAFPATEPRPYCRKQLSCEPHPLLHLQYWELQLRFVSLALVCEPRIRLSFQSIKLNAGIIGHYLLPEGVGLVCICISMLPVKAWYMFPDDGHSSPFQ